jgi:hypothetical protein
MRGSVVVSATGDDPSVGDRTRVHNTPVNSAEEMHRALCPDGMTKEDRSSLYNNMLDIAALPGMSKQSEGMASTDIAALAQMLGSEQGVASHRTNIGWRNASKDTLRKIKNRVDLERVVKELNSVRNVAVRGQTNRLHALLESLHYSPDSVQLYLSSGLLPVLVTRSFEFFHRLLCTVRDEAYQVISGTAWSNSLAAAMLSTHSEKLVMIRQYAMDWRDYLVQVYVYLRDAQLQDFRDASMIRQLWHRPAVSLAAAPPPDLCSHCHRSRMHPVGRNHCLLLPLPAAKARQVLMDLEDDIALAVAEHIAAAFVHSPRANHDQVVAAALAACA